MPEKQLEFIEQTPSGIEVLYQAEPKRLYKVRRPYSKGNAVVVVYPGEWLEVPSVTTVLDVLNKAGLPWWGQGIGVEGVQKLHNLGLLRTAYMPNGNAVLTIEQEGQWVVAGKELIVDLLTRTKLTVNHIRDDAGTRGNNVHTALEQWAEDGILPDPSLYPPEEQGYVQGLLQFLEHVQPEVVGSEVMVGSLEHGFAGRYDLDFKLDEERTVVFHRTPKRGPQWATLPPGLYKADLKTSSGVYFSHFKQLAGYEIAAVECGHPATDGQGVIHVNADGTYEFVRSIAVADDFLTTLAEWRSQEAMKERRRSK